MNKDIPLLVFLLCVGILIYLYLTDELEDEGFEGIPPPQNQAGLRFGVAEYHE